MRIFDRDQTIRALPYGKLVPAVSRAAQELASGAINAPERQVVTIDPASVLLSMPAIGNDISVAKLITVHGNNARHQLPSIQGEVVVFETATGRRLALLDGPSVTARRTAAMTLLGIETLTRKKPESVLIIGTGTQAAAHADALAEYFGVARFWIAGPTPAHVQSFASALQQRHPHVAVCLLTVESLKQEVPETDVVIALTTSSVPVIPSSISAATFAVGIGAFKPGMAEFPSELLHTRQIVVDDLRGARHEAGDLIQAKVDWTSVVQLADILSGKTQAPATVPVFKTVGQAAWDLAAARVAITE
ncbi:delta(1)-pyrroline-2-carboxylate reductase family protein [soil metagenome]